MSDRNLSYFRMEVIQNKQISGTSRKKMTKAYLKLCLMFMIFVSVKNVRATIAKHAFQKFI